MPLFDSVPREQYHDALRQRDRAQDALAHAHELIAGKDTYWQAILEAERTRHQALVDQIVAMKRSEMSMHPPGFDPAASDPMSLVGPMTEAAIEQTSQGDPELRVYNRNIAIRETMTRTDDDPEVRDQAVAALILEGDE